MLPRSSLALFAILTLSGCSEMAQMRQDITRLERGLRDQRMVQADQTSKISDIETQLRQISGKIEELEYSQTRKIGTDVASLKSDISALRKRVPPPPIVPEALLTEDELAVGKLPSELQEAVTNGLQMLREGNFTKALSYWDDVVSLTQGTEWEPAGLFWRAVTEEGLNDNAKAVEDYLALVSRFKKHDRVPVAMLRQASVLIRIGDKKTAKLVLNKLVADFPKAPEAALAKNKLKDL